jgi:hypothetical protein
MKIQPLSFLQRARLHRHASEQRHRRLTPWLLLVAALLGLGVCILGALGKL